jgi:hypothetical protein
VKRSSFIAHSNGITPRLDINSRPKKKEVPTGRTSFFLLYDFEPVRLSAAKQLDVTRLTAGR